jgi:hypothetical protein
MNSLEVMNSVKRTQVHQKILKAMDALSEVWDANKNVIINYEFLEDEAAAKRYAERMPSLIADTVRKLEAYRKAIADITYATIGD